MHVILARRRPDELNNPPPSLISLQRGLMITLETGNTGANPIWLGRSRLSGSPALSDLPGTLTDHVFLPAWSAIQCSPNGATRILGQHPIEPDMMQWIDDLETEAKPVEEYVTDILSALRTSAERFSERVGRAPVAMSMSGGIDSCLVAVLARDAGVDLRYYTLGSLTAPSRDQVYMRQHVKAFGLPEPEIVDLEHLCNNASAWFAKARREFLNVYALSRNERLTRDCFGNFVAGKYANDQMGARDLLTGNDANIMHVSEMPIYSRDGTALADMFYFDTDDRHDVMSYMGFVNGWARFRPYSYMNNCAEHAVFRMSVPDCINLHTLFHDVGYLKVMAKIPRKDRYRQWLNGVPKNKQLLRMVLRKLAPDCAWDAPKVGQENYKTMIVDKGKVFAGVVMSQKQMTRLPDDEVLRVTH